MNSMLCVVPPAPLTIVFLLFIKPETLRYILFCIIRVFLLIFVSLLVYSSLLLFFFFALFLLFYHVLSLSTFFLCLVLMMKNKHY